MRRLALVGMLLTVALATQAQLGRKIAPQMQKGAEKSYVVKTITETAGQAAVTSTSEDHYAVVDATADGYVIDVTTTSYTTDAAADNLPAQMRGIGQSMMKGITVRMATDKDGKPVKLLNMDEVKPKMTAAAKEAIEKLYKANPAMAQAVPQEAMLQQLEQSLTEAALLSSLGTSSSIFVLNGKTVMTGAQEEYVGEQGIKMKRMYFANGDNITTSSSLNMTNDEIKALILSQLEKALQPDQVEMVKQNIDQMMQSGMLKIDVKETATYALQADGWVKSIKVERNIENPGETVKETTEVTCK